MRRNRVRWSATANIVRLTPLQNEDATRTGQAFVLGPKHRPNQQEIPRFGSCPEATPVSRCLIQLSFFIVLPVMADVSNLLQVPPTVAPPLDPNFRPIALGMRAYARAVVGASQRVPLSLALERHDGQVSVFRTEIFPTGSAMDPVTIRYVERLVKFLLWQIGGWRLIVGGPRALGDAIAHNYRAGGARAFDVQLLERVYGRPAVVESVDPDQVPSAKESPVALGGHLDGCRIGFDLGASDYKLAAVRDGEAVFTTEIPWDPKIEPDPEFHYQRIHEGLKLAASHLPRVDAIGGSAAGIYIDNQVMVASLFRAVPASRFEPDVKPLFRRLQREWGVPLEVANDGDVTALAGAMSLRVHGLLGVAMGSSQAAGYLNPDGRITGWLNELAFAPIDYHPHAPPDEWSGDLGCGVQYFSQQAVVRLAHAAEISLPPGHPADQLKAVQDLHQQGDPRVPRIFETIGVYLGYALAQYATHYPFEHLLVLGRVTSGPGGDLILRKAREVLDTDFPELADHLALHLPDEKSKRVGQAVAAASLPRL
jgi:predicted NBD/HSP70 family sugar kinase